MALTCLASERLPTSTFIKLQRVPTGEGEGPPGFMHFIAHVTAYF